MEIIFYYIHNTYKAEIFRYRKQWRYAMKNERENALDKKFQALSNQIKREILIQLSIEPLSAGGIANYFQITPASISYHLSLLQKSSLISCRKIERHRIYSINHSALNEVYLWFTYLKKK